MSSVDSRPTKARMEAFSDGVFAVAITLLVLDIKLPEVDAHASLWHALGHNWSHYLAYAISFLTIGVMWVNHHNMLHTVEFADHGLLYSNLGLLAVIAFIPFPTSVLSEYVRDGSSEHLQAAVGLYGLTMIALGTTFSLMWLHIYHHPEIRRRGTTNALIRKDVLRSCGGTACYATGTLIGIFLPYLALAIFAGLVVLFAVARPATARATVS
ncbi:uncharacterized membrane protein [Jatrophihabitans sp. GAS493]|uniref:TMEM175 family protein n=1 Tax=Jatrophihabitans sp. GAS493 TaxID=1907575 RepID=UPI000BB9B401|nr:TMEM175 family protein [Jatrophihabitans sp. GAS493]SOD71052.1 uncharacterized membrane protein [Jatrophihabitans sp. GAS493]